MSFDPQISLGSHTITLTRIMMNITNNKPKNNYGRRKSRFTYCNVFALMSKMKTIEHEFLNNNTGYDKLHANSC